MEFKGAHLERRCEIMVSQDREDRADSKNIREVKSVSFTGNSGVKETELSRIILRIPAWVKIVMPLTSKVIQKGMMLGKEWGMDEVKNSVWNMISLRDPWVFQVEL